MTLDGLGTAVELCPTDGAHSLKIDDIVIDGAECHRLVAFLEHIRDLHPYDNYWAVKTNNTIPIAAGLASSASFFAALALALNEGLSLNLSKEKLSCLARLGSASAARSIFGGFVGLHGGMIDAHEAYAFPIKSSLDVVMLLALVKRSKKPLSSREAMNHTAKTSPFYNSFLDAHRNDFLAAQQALKSGDFAGLGQIMEHSTLKMHACMWAAKPAVNYILPMSLTLIECVQKLRAEHGPIAYFTLDAGPNVKVLCQKKDQALVKNALLQIIPDVLSSKIGSGASLL